MSEDGAQRPPWVLRMGVDLVHSPTLERRLSEPGARERVFQPTELADRRPEHLAGVLAAKEALFKALGKRLPWHAVEVTQGPGGRPQLRWAGAPQGLQADVSISHHGEYAVAVVVLVLPEGGGV